MLWDSIFILVFCELSLEELNDLNYGNYHKAKTDCGDIFNEVNACKSECACKEGNLTHKGGGNERTNACEPQDLVVRAEGEDASSLRAHVEAVEDFSHG